jgi:hypothetical protein
MPPEFGFIWLGLWVILYLVRKQTKNHDNLLPSAMYFSSWALVWGMLYVFVIVCLNIYSETTQKENERIADPTDINALKWFNPTVALLVSLSYQGYLFYRATTRSTPDNLLRNLKDISLTTTIMKFIPLLLVITHYPVSWMYSMGSFTVSWILYMCYISAQNENVMTLYGDYSDSFRSNKPPKYQF